MFESIKKTIVVPIEMLSWHQVRLPKGKRRGLKLRSILEGILEDRLLDDPKLLQFAVEPKIKNDHLTWVAVCEKSSLNYLLKEDISVRKSIVRLVPEFSPAVNSTPKIWLVGTEKSSKIVVINTDWVYQLPISLVDSALITSIKRNNPGVQIFSEPHLVDFARDNFELDPILVTAEERRNLASDTERCPFQFEPTQSTGYLNLIESIYRYVVLRPECRLLHYSAAFFLIAHLVVLQVYSLRIKNELASIKIEMNRILTDSFPETRIIIDPAFQMQRAVNALNERSGVVQHRDFERILEIIGTLVPKNFSPATLKFSGDSLRVGFISADTAVTQRLVEGLQSRGYRTRLDNDSIVIIP